MTDDYSFLFDLLSIPNNGSYTLSNVDLSGPDKTLTIERPSSPTFCPACNSRMHSKGLYTRMISHPVFQEDNPKLRIVFKDDSSCQLDQN